MNCKPSFLVLTLGCKLNQLESESIIDVFLQSGFKQAAGSSVSVIIVNTCTVTSKADQKARRVIRKALRDYPQSCVLVTGCYAQLNKGDLLKLDEGGFRRLFVINKDNVLDLISCFDVNDDFFSAVRTWEKSVVDTGNDRMRKNIFQFNPKKFSQHTRSFLKIQDGCDKHCTYCRIRLARGKSLSLEAPEVLSRLFILEKSHAEAVLTGVNISQYKDKIFDLTGLLRYLLDNTEKIAVRLSSLEPECIDENLAGVLSHKRIRPHFHLSVQSGCKKILERMGRSYDAEIIERAVSLLRGVKDDPFLACDIITGFPGETEADFEETFSFCQKMDFAWIHVFPYSKRPGTPAFALKEKVSESEVTHRVQLLTGLANKGRAEYIRRWLGREVEVLVEKSEQLTINNEQRKSFCSGLSGNYLKVLVRCEGSHSLPGSVLCCRLIEKNNFEDYDAQGVPL